MVTFIKNKALLVGTSFSAIPMFDDLQNRNLTIAVCGGTKSDPCHQYTENSFHLDYSNKEDLSDLVSKEKFDFIVPSCNDYSYLSCAWAAEQHGLAGFDPYETTLTLHTKDAFRSFTEKHGFPVPKAQQIDNIESVNLPFPLLLKPIDSFSGRGITKIFNDSELQNAVTQATSNSRSQKAIVEEFVDGSLYSHSAFIRDGQIVIDVFADEFCTVYPYQVNCSNIPSTLDKKLQNIVRECLSELSKSLNLVDGLLHTQFIVDGQNFWIIECMRRAPGDLYGKMVELATGIDYTHHYVSPFLNEKLPTAVSTPYQKCIGRHTISTAGQQIFTSFTDNIPSGKTHFVPLKQSGELLEKAPFDKAGIIFAEFINESALSKHIPYLAEYIDIQ